VSRWHISYARELKQIKEAGFYIKAAEETCERFAIIDQDIILNDLCHKIGERYRQVIRPGITQRNRQARLRIRIHEKDFLSFHGQSDTQVFTGGGLARAAFLIGYCRDGLMFLT